MPARRFQLPGIQELTKEQERAIRLPTEGRHLIMGGPGTGKSVVALLRIRRLIKDQDCIFLMYNRLLHKASCQLYGEGLPSSTWVSWFMKVFFQLTQEKAPLVETEAAWKPIDWESVLEKIGVINTPCEGPTPKIIIDEGQDMPPEFYEALIGLGFENFYVVADQNQRITSENSSRQQLQDILSIDPGEVVELTENFRNSYPIARLAREFYPDDPASPQVELPGPKPSSQVPLLVEYGHGCRLDFDGVLTRILKMADRRPSKLIGVITPNNRVRETYLNGLMRMAQLSSMIFDNGLPQTTTFKSGARGTCQFDEGGILVINAQSAKGLEFDRVFIADIHEFSFNHSNQDQIRRLFYVMIARAIERVILIKKAGQHCAVQPLLPKDENILKYWR